MFNKMASDVRSNINSFQFFFIIHKKILVLVWFIGDQTSRYDQWFPFSWICSDLRMLYKPSYFLLFK